METTIQEPVIVKDAIRQSFESFYNLALDHAIAIVQEHGLPEHPSTLLNSIIRQLENLKK